MNWGRLIIGGALLYYGVLRGAKGLVVKVKDWSLRSLDLNSGTVSLNLNFCVKNPLVVGLTLNSIVGNVFMQGKQVGTINTVLNYHISGGRTHVIPVVVNLDIASVGSAAILNIQSGNIRNLTIAFDGKVNVGRFDVGVPLQIDLNYEDLTE